MVYVAVHIECKLLAVLKGRASVEANRPPSSYDRTSCHRNKVTIPGVLLETVREHKASV